MMQGPAVWEQQDGDGGASILAAGSEVLAVAFNTWGEERNG